MEEETYYKKILVSSGEVPEEDDYYHTDFGLIQYNPHDNEWHAMIDDYWESFEPTYWLKEIPVPSPKQEAVEFAEWCAMTQKPIVNNYIVSWSPNYDKREEGIFTSELYDKFKSDGKNL